MLGYQSLLVGLDKLRPNIERMQADLDTNWEVLGEAIQTVMRRYGHGDAYEQMKNLTRGAKVGADDLREFVRNLDIPDDAKSALLSLEPSTYVGLAEILARKSGDRENS
jgi:adenylosuccinate lyase